MSESLALIGRVLRFVDDPYRSPPDQCLVCDDPGVIVVAEGRIQAIGDRSLITPGIAVTDYGQKLILPGFIDAHVHYPQSDAIAGCAGQLLDWLEGHIFPSEIRLADPAVAESLANWFLDELIRSGVTTAAVFCTSHPASADAFLGAARARGMRMIAGKVGMDRNAPAELCDTPQRAYDESAELLGRWDGVDRLHYAISPRFAVSSTEAQLEAMGALAAEHPDAFIQSHVSENLKEVETVAALFPNDASYTAVYQRFGLLRPKALYGHGVHLRDDELALFRETGAAVVHCPTSNSFLGSGLFDLARAKAAGTPVAMGSDVGGGTSLSPLRTLSEAYLVSALRGSPLDPVRAFWLATAGSARAMGLGDRIGTLAPGKDADMVVLDPWATPQLALRADRARDLADLLAALMILGDDRAVAATWIAGREAMAK